MDINDNYKEEESAQETPFGIEIDIPAPDENRIEESEEKVSLDNQFDEEESEAKNEMNSDLKGEDSGIHSSPLRDTKDFVLNDNSKDSNNTEDYFIDQPNSLPELIPITSKPVLNNFEELPVLTPEPTLNGEVNDKLDSSDASQMPGLVPIPESLLSRRSENDLMEDDIDKLLNFMTKSDEEDSMEEATKSPVADKTPNEDNLIEEVVSPDSNSSPSTTTKSPESEKSPKKTTFVDSLLDKIRRKHSNSDGSGTEMTKFEKVLSGSEDDLLVEVDTPIRYNQPSNPNLMATPIVKNSRSSASVFVSNEEEYKELVAKHKERKPVVEDKNQMGARSEPPRMKEPEMPTNIQRPRTLAEKRKLINNQNYSLKFLMAEQESKIYRQVQRQKSQMEINYSLLDNILVEDIPINHGTWKVLTWLRTHEGKYFQQYLNVDNAKLKLCGSRGNHDVKTLPAQSSLPFSKRQSSMLRSTRCCYGGRIGKRTIETLVKSESIRRFVLEEWSEQFSKMDAKLLECQLVSIKPRPLSKKIELLNKNRKLKSLDEDSVFLGDYSKFDMPKVQLEVSVKQKTPLDSFVKKYLKEILPHRDLDEKWCEFALTAFMESSEIEEAEKKFDFEIPYQGNKTSILVRTVTRGKEDFEPLRILPGDDDEDDMVWTFAENVDKTDPIECEVVDVIKDLTNSVFINLNDDLFTQDDPQTRQTPSSTSPMKSMEAIEELSKVTKPDRKSKKILKELRRLNANVVQSEASFVEDENDVLRNATAHLGKVERELRPTVLVTESDTVLLGNQEKDSRRVKRAPKKFDDYDNNISKKSSNLSDSELDEPQAKKFKKGDQKAEDWQNYRIRSQDFSRSTEELKKVKEEVTKMIHVNVSLRRLENLDGIEPWCMIHCLYKCHCKGLIESHAVEQERVPKIVIKKVVEPPKTPQPEVEPSHPSTPEVEENFVDDGFSRRVLPVEVEPSRSKVSRPVTSAILSGTENLPKIEIKNICQLINGGVGPIFIEVYEDNSIRLNPIFRSVLNNKSAIIYFEGFAYFINRKRVDIQKLDFSPLVKDLEHPIFIIQAKDLSPPPVSSTNSDDFVKFLFNKNSKSYIQINDKIALKEIGEIIESILRNVRKKIEAQIEGEATELVKNQLSMLTCDRSRSQSFSSSNSSPLHFNGHKLTEAPPPGLQTPLMKDFNKIFSVRMQRLVALISSNTLGLQQSRELFNKFYIYQWHLFLKSFEEALIQVWQVQLEGESGSKYQILVMTDSLEVPAVEHAKKENIVNIRKLKISNNMPELTRLILLRVEKASMKNLTVLLYGCKGYMRIGGLLNSKESYLSGFVAKPSRATHPRIAAKIQKMYHIWYAWKMRQAQKNQNSISNDKAANKVVEKKKLESHPLSSLAKMPGHSDFKWFLFNITNDFSDIYIKSWSRHLSYKVIMEAIKKAKKNNRAVSLVSSVESHKRWPRIYALPTAPLKFKEHDLMTDNYLIFGPYLRQSNSNLLLVQNVDGQLMLRDDYERQNNIRRKTRTRCLWIYANKLKCIVDADPRPLKLAWSKDGAACTVNTEKKD